MGKDGRPFVLDGIGDSPPTPSSLFKEDEGPPSSPRIGIILTRWPVCGGMQWYLGDVQVLRF